MYVPRGGKHTVVIKEDRESSWRNPVFTDHRVGFGAFANADQDRVINPSIKWIVGGGGGNQMIKHVMTRATVGTNDDKQRCRAAEGWRSDGFACEGSESCRWKGFFNGRLGATAAGCACSSMWYNRPIFRTH